MRRTIKVQLIDNHAIFRMGVAKAISENLNFHVVDESSSGFVGLQKAKVLEPDVVLITPNVKDTNILEIIRGFRAISPDIRMVVFTESDAERSIIGALSEGAYGYLSQDVDSENLCQILLDIFLGVTTPPSHQANQLQNSSVEPSESKAIERRKLTGREHQILELLAAGLNNKAIASKLGITLTTVKVHVKNLLLKMDKRSRLEAAMWVCQHHSNSETSLEF